MLLQLIKKHFPYGEIVNAYAYGSDGDSTAYKSVLIIHGNNH